MYYNYKPLQQKKCNFIKEVVKNEFIEDNGSVTMVDSKYEILIPELKNFLFELSGYNSHITLKFRQTINYIQNFKFYEKFLKKYKDKFFVIEELASEINNIRENNKELIELIPPSFFDIDIKFKDKGNFSALSSGEKQKIYSSASIIYHLINLNSVRNVESKNTNDKLNYFECINLVFDEVELYFHPDLQRTFISDLLFNIRKLYLPNIKSINCIFVTHSPFILSDIPSQNILFLDDDGTPINHRAIGKTFGANIHDLLKHSFFLNNGYMGKFATEVINETITFLNLAKVKKETKTIREGSNLYKLKILEKSELEMKVTHHDHFSHKNIIQIIGEPILRLKLLEMYDDYFGVTELQKLQNRISELTELENRLKSKK